MLIHNYSNTSLRKAKTDKKDAVLLANYGIDKWHKLPRFIPEDEVRMQLKYCYRQYQHYSKINSMLQNNLISLLDLVFPNANRFFTSPPRANGSDVYGTLKISQLAH